MFFVDGEMVLAQVCSCLSPVAPGNPMRLVTELSMGIQNLEYGCVCKRMQTDNELM